MMNIAVCTSAEKEPDFVSRQIMRWIGKPYSHIYIVYKGMMYHCVERGICAEPYEYYMYDHIEAGRKEVPLECTEQEFFDYMADLMKKKIGYSFSQYIGFAIPYFKKYVRNGREKSVCSEMVAWVMTDLAKRKEFEDPDFLDPQFVFDKI